MPAALFEPQNAAALKKYEDITIDLFRAFGGLDVGMQVGACKDVNYSYPAGSKLVAWAPATMMEGICAQQCHCNYQSASLTARSASLPPCKDQPDNPAAMEWCSLCGPLYNEPISVNLYYCSDCLIPAQHYGCKCKIPKHSSRDEERGARSGFLLY